MTESDSIGRWNKKTRYSLTKGSSVSRPGGTQAAFPNHRQEGEEEGDPSIAEQPTLSTSQLTWVCKAHHFVNIL